MAGWPGVGRSPPLRRSQRHLGSGDEMVGAGPDGTGLTRRVGQPAPKAAVVFWAEVVKRPCSGAPRIAAVSGAFAPICFTM